MTTFNRPYWILLTVTLPLALLFLYYANIYTLVASELGPRNLKYWYYSGTVLGSLWLGASGYALWLIFRGRAVSWRYGVPVLAAVALFAHIHLNGGGRMLPGSVREWMVSSFDAMLLPFGLIMPALIHALLLLVLRLTPAYGRRALWQTLAATIALPALWYLAVRFLPPLLRGSMSWAMREHLQLVLFIIPSVLFMFLLMRLFYLLAIKLQHSHSHAAWLLRGAIAIGLPLLALLTYNGELFQTRHSISELKLFGDWSHPALYLFIVVNGLLLTLPWGGRAPLRLALFAASALLYPLVSYFFVVFLPFFPLAISGVLFFGLGFLLLAPLLLFALQSWWLRRDFIALRHHYGTVIPAVIFIVAFTIAPLSLTLSYHADRTTLATMLDHLYEADYDATAPVSIDHDSAARLLSHIRSLKRSADPFSGTRRPYLTSYYQWLVLDNMTLSDARLATLGQIFLGDPVVERGQPRPLPEKRPEVTRIEEKTRRSEDGSYYISTVDLEITNHNEGQFAQDEFATRFHLPAGAWVRSYYLMIDGRRVEGILSERSSAMWVYQQARDSRRDPGLLYYTDADELILRIFPFTAGEVRQSGFELVHREPLTLELEGHQLTLADSQPLLPVARPDNQEPGVVWVSAAEKARLPLTQRRPYLHFIIDRSAAAADRLPHFRRRIEHYLAQHLPEGVNAQGARITLANYDGLTLPYTDGWYPQAETVVAGGGFFLERALKHALSRNYRHPEWRYPLFVVVTDGMANALFTDGMDDFALTLPEGDRFILLDDEKGGTVRRLAAPRTPLEAPHDFYPVSQQVRAWPDATAPRAFLRDDNRASLVITEGVYANQEWQGQGDAWRDGLQLYGQWLGDRLNPAAGLNKNHAMVANSFRAQLLSPLTAYLSPESELQRRVLLQKQQQVLASRGGLDLGEEQQMDEPPLWLMVLLAGLYWRWRRGRESPQMKGKRDPLQISA